MDEIAIEPGRRQVTPERWSLLRQLFTAALETPESERTRFLESTCGVDTNLRADLERLLAGNEELSWQSPVARLFPLAAELAPGDVLGHYRIEAKLGQGGMGRVYSAYDSRLHRRAALKVLPPEHLADPESRQRLTREARAASALNHPNIVTVYEIGSERDVDFISMEYVEGESLARAIPPKGLPLARALDYSIEITAALAKAHAAGIIHRDLKPANIMLTPECHIKLLDFGLAQRMRTIEGLTGNGEIAGTLGYMSPEQVQGLPVDQTTDLFSFGVVFYEMLTGERPFTGRTPGRLKAILGKLLEKNPANRYRSAEEVHHQLQALKSSLAPAPHLRLSRNAWMGAWATAIVICVLAGWLWRRSSRERWALQTAMPEIARLIDSGEDAKAGALARAARAVLPGDPTLEELWTRATGEVSIASLPSGAEVSLQPYHGNRNTWEKVGKTPLKKVRVPRQAYVWRLVKAGFAPALFIGEPPGVLAPGSHNSFDVAIKLRPKESVPPEMVVVPGGRAALAYPLAYAPSAQIDGFLIDRHEVTNEEYRKFMDAGGYQRREFWKQPFVKNGRTIPWIEAVALFHDATGRPGPATWEMGGYPKRREKYPVAGVSWYEAAAYAEFARKSLPTAYHWTRASQSAGLTPLIAPGSNFRRDGTQPVGREGTLSGFGTTDMAGNVKEWCWNEVRGAKRLILGGGFGEPEYMFHHTDAQSPWDRRANFGFRCVKLDSPPSPNAAARIETTTRDYSKERPVSDEVFKAYTTLYTYDKSDLNSQVEETSMVEGWPVARVSFDAAYGHERVIAYLFLPKNASPPFQAVVYMPGADSFSDAKLDLSSVVDNYDFLLKSGRVLLVPIYKGMYQRRDGLRAGDRNQLAFRRDHEIAWAKDLGRSLDYLDTRNDIDATKIAYVGFSLGGTEGAHIPAVENRIKTAILLSGGLQVAFRYLPEGDPLNFVTHVTIPVLMLNGRYDATFPLESSQQPLFHFLATPVNAKKLVIYEGGHGVFPRPAAVRESLNWLNKYLGKP